MTTIEQFRVDRPAHEHPSSLGGVLTGPAADTQEWAAQADVQEWAARKTLKAQVARLERELSGIVARGFPHIAPMDPNSEPSQQRQLGCPRLLTLGELERQRDELVLRVRVARVQASEREQLERRSRKLLEEFRREPHRHKFARLAVSDLGEGSCGVWQVRPRLGLIGMLAGWWQVKLSSGCP
jgi:hypothetical protein